MAPFHTCLPVGPIHSCSSPSTKELLGLTFIPVLRNDNNDTFDVWLLFHIYETIGAALQTSDDVTDKKWRTIAV